MRPRTTHAISPLVCVGGGGEAKERQWRVEGAGGGGQGTGGSAGERERERERERPSERERARARTHAVNGQPFSSHELRQVSSAATNSDRRVKGHSVGA